MDPKKGDILQHVGFSPRASLRRQPSKLAEVMNVREDAIMLHVSEEPEAKYIKRFEILRWWEVMPKLGDMPPPWVKKGAVFRPRDVRGVVPKNRAVIHSASPGWVTFYDRMDGVHVFRIIAYDTFTENWHPDESPSVWDHILNGMV